MYIEGDEKAKVSDVQRDLQEGRNAKSAYNKARTKSQTANDVDRVSAEASEDLV